MLAPSGERLSMLKLGRAPNAVAGSKDWELAPNATTAIWLTRMLHSNRRTPIDFLLDISSPNGKPALRSYQDPVLHRCVGGNTRRHLAGNDLGQLALAHDEGFRRRERGNCQNEEAWVSRSTYIGMLKASITHCCCAPKTSCSWSDAERFGRSIVSLMALQLSTKNVPTTCSTRR